MLYARGVARQRRTTDPVRTREAILASATRLFSERGYAATSIGDVAADAGVTKSLVQYHYQSKEALWQAALTAQVEPLLQLVDNMRETHQIDPVGLFEKRFQLLSESPVLGRMMVWSAMNPELLPESIRARVRDVMEGPVSENLLRLMILFAATDGYFQFRRIYSQLVSHDLTTPEIEAAFKALLLDTVMPSGEKSR